MSSMNVVDRLIFSLSYAKWSLTMAITRGSTDTVRPSGWWPGHRCSAAAVVATLLTPVLMPGLPVIIAAVVAIVVGWFNWLGGGAAGSAGEEPIDVPEREGLP